jgi:hypothetical protein
VRNRTPVAVPFRRGQNDSGGQFDLKKPFRATEKQRSINSETDCELNRRERAETWVISGWNRGGCHLGPLAIF